MRICLAAALFAIVFACAPARAGAQQQPPPTPESASADQQNRIGESHLRYVGHFEYEKGDLKMYADTADLFRNDDRAILVGNVVVRQGNNQISADRADFNTKTRLGTFFNATGFATIQPPKPQAPRPGAMAPPPVIAQETVVYFFGETVEKTGLRKYKIKNGGFTSCVQPTPRWSLSSNTIILSVDHYTFLRNAVMTVKGVPMLYLPIMYYPTKKGDRATGFLLPTYGTSTLRGQSLSDAFFWAIDRSQDATFLYDWFSKTGQGTGAEYRYNFGGGSDGNIRTYLLDQHDVLNTDGSQTPSGSRSYELHGAANQIFPGNLHARANIDYFSSFATNQTFSTDINVASMSQRSFGGNVVGTWGSYSLNGTFNHTEYFASQTNSTLTGSWPRIALARNERPIEGTPFYLSLNGEYVRLLQENRDETSGADVDLGVTRLDFTPQIRFPFKKWEWFTVNSTASWRDTYYTRSYDPATIDPTGLTPAVVIDEGLNRRFFALQSQITGPVFSKVWDTPGNGFAEKFKHSVEPYLNIQVTSSIDNYDRIVKLEGVDQIVGGATQYTYGFTNRFYAKRRPGPGLPAQAREIFTVDLQQTYYTNDLASTVDRQYSTSNTGATPSNFSPIALSVRAQPSNEFNATLRAEFDATYAALRTVSATGSYTWSTNVQASIGWSKTAYIPQLSTFDNSAESINASTNMHTRDNKYGVIYSLNYDVLSATMLQQSMSGFYNSQCCGLSFQYQNYHYPGNIAAVPSDHRFFLSFTLAGLGNFSPFNNAMNGVPR